MCYLTENWDAEQYGDKGNGPHNVLTESGIIHLTQKISLDFFWTLFPPHFKTFRRQNTSFDNPFCMLDSQMNSLSFEVFQHFLLSRF